MSKPVISAANCPVCESSLTVVNYKFVCSNNVCSVKVKDILANYFELLNHKSFDSKLLITLVKDFNIASISDLKKLTKSKIKKLNNSDIIVDTLNTTQTITKDQLINLIQPKNNGIGVIRHFMDNTDIEVLLNSNTTAENIIDISMVDDSSREELIEAINKQLDSIRETSKFFTIEGLSNNTLNNRIFCLTNSMKKDTMKHYEQLITNNGGRIGTVSMKLDFLVTNTDDNTKYRKVVETNTKLYNSGKTHSIIIIDESDLLKMMEK